jgi:hypothetical protein
LNQRYLESFELLLKFGKSSFLRKQESSLFKIFWIPAYAGMTKWRYFSKLSSSGLRSLFTWVERLSEICAPDKADFDGTGIDTPSAIPYNRSENAEHRVEVVFPGAEDGKK